MGPKSSQGSLLEVGRRVRVRQGDVSMKLEVGMRSQEPRNVGGLSRLGEAGEGIRP